MGYRCRWLATRGRERNDVLERLQLQIVGELIEEVYDPGFYALEVEDWLVVIGDGRDDMTKVKRNQAQKLSDGGEVLYLDMDDSVMAFELAMFRDNAEAWSVAYDGSDGVTDPQLHGAVPWDVRVLLARLEKQQAGAGGPKAEVDHIYELGATYAGQLVGFRHDETLGSGNHVPVWQVTETRGKPRNG